MLKFIKVFVKGFKFYFKHFVNVVEDIEKQEKIIEEQGKAKNPNPYILGDTYTYLQKLVNIFREIFPSAISILISILALLISVIALIFAILK